MMDSNSYYGGGTNPFAMDSTGQSFSDWQSLTGFDANSSYSPSLPVLNQIFVRPNQYEIGRANIIVYNWENLNAVNVDVSNSGLQVGDHFEVRDVQNYLGTPVITGIYNGSAISLPMNLTTVTPLIGNVTHFTVNPNQHTGSDFAAFVLMKDASSGVTVQAPTLSPVGGIFSGSHMSISMQSNTAGAQIRYTIDGSDPTTSSSLYAGPLDITATTTVKASSFLSGNQSPVSMEIYTWIDNPPTITSIANPLSFNVVAVDSFGCITQASATINFNVLPTPDPYLSATDSGICKGVNATLSATITGNYPGSTYL